MNDYKKQRGFAAVEVVIAIIVLGLLSGAGWLVYSRRESSKETSKATKTPTNQQEAKLNQTKVILSQGKISFYLPENWQEKKSSEACQAPATSAVECIESTTILPNDSPRNSANEPFEVNISVNKVVGDKSVKDWFYEDYLVAVETDEHSNESINGYDTYYRKQTTESNIDVWYVFIKDHLATVVYSRVSETHFKPGGNEIDEHKDNTNYLPELVAFVKSVHLD